MHQMAALSRHPHSMLTTSSPPSITHTRRLNPPSLNLVSFPLNQPLRSNHTNLSLSKLHTLCAIGGGEGNDGVGRHGGGGGGDGDDSGSNSKDRSSDGFGILGLLLSGWRDRVAADPQFPFKVIMEELVGVSACVLGDMASRPNFGLNELDFVFSTLVVGSIMNFTIMYLLAPTASASSSSLPFIFANCPQSHMFEPGCYTLMNRLGTAVFKGAVFAAVGFGAGLVGTAISNGLIKLRKKMDPTFETPNKPPPTLLNAVTWATHMGVSSNLRMTGSQSVAEKPAMAEEEKLVGVGGGDN
ncbi:RETICULATA-RELATED 3 [Hibiscus trionum]|uniref:RETICULATA-RELATED 3 n=1 Tax=Hibiscus trionum TaxID=183268 RepID=A0A9W7I6T9_HIBTR|nr:RETICULATA-RELATED 3 [Hibiscus trionum]